MLDTQIKCLKDLNLFRTAPNLNALQRKNLLEELFIHMDQADWFTLGIMASSKQIAISNLRQIEFFFDWPSMTIASEPNQTGPVFLKGNQKTNDVYIRIEGNLGEGILISCQKDSKDGFTETFGPFPLNIFRGNN